jgi:hypothetical protein
MDTSLKKSLHKNCTYYISKTPREREREKKKKKKREGKENHTPAAESLFTTNASISSKNRRAGVACRASAKDLRIAASASPTMGE